MYGVCAMACVQDRVQTLLDPTAVLSEVLAFLGLKDDSLSPPTNPRTCLQSAPLLSKVKEEPREQI